MPITRYLDPILWDVSLEGSPSFAVLFPRQTAADDHVVIRFALGPECDPKDAIRSARAALELMAPRRESLPTSRPDSSSP